jgi:hypothetical protein
VRGAQFLFAQAPVEAMTSVLRLELPVVDVAVAEESEPGFHWQRLVPTVQVAYVLPAQVITWHPVPAVLTSQKGFPAVQILVGMFEHPVAVTHVVEAEVLAVDAVVCK